MRSEAERLAAVERVVAAARRVKEDPALAPAIAESTGLSLEGATLALERHLELEPTAEDLARLVAGVTETERVTVILSANVFVGALRAVALARAASDDVVVRPSRRDPAFATALLLALGEEVRLVTDVDVGAVATGEIHVYGRDETIADVRSKAHVPVRGHGSGMGVAWISAGADLVRAATDLADDVVVFDQRGCLSPRIALVGGGPERAERFARALHDALESRGLEIPRGEVPSAERVQASRYVSTMTFARGAFVGNSHAIGLANEDGPLLLPPPWRHVHVAPATDAADAVRRLDAIARAVVAVGSNDLTEARRIAPAWARVSPLGWMQRPALDGPVDRRDDGSSG